MTSDGPSAAPTPVQASRILEREARFRQPTLYLRLALTAAFALAPVLLPSFQLMDLMLKIALFATLVASYDVVIGYTGIVSFGHAMFFGFGAYAVGLSLGKFGAPTYGYLALAFALGVLVSAALALVIGAFSLRVKALFFAMITLAFAEYALILAVQLSHLTGGEDGISPKLPGVFAVSFTAGKVLGVDVNGRVVTYYVVLVVCLALFLTMSRFVHSPLGRTLQAIRDNEQRAEALGYRTFIFQLISSSFGSVVAAVLGGCYAMWVRYVNPESALSIQIMLDVLLMVIIGGMGTLYGGIIGAAVLLTARTLLPDLRAVGTLMFPGSEILQRLTERWLLYFGILFILVVFFFPKGVIGTVREVLSRRNAAR
ncbi:MAG: branched-chain amino acid ABC transporter permease [Candidatus Rokubacteria bacterium]|nr:branched-chain amino acid ABC transporter permease [Candidatus Rokubacteria bacterium]